MSGWIAAGDVQRDRRPMTKLESEAFEEVRSLALEYGHVDVAGRAPFIAMVRSVTTPKQRNFTVLRMSTDDEAWKPLMRVFDAIIDANPDVIPTRHGIFDTDAITMHAGRPQADENGEMFIQFPDGEGRYRTPGQRGPAIEDAPAVELEWWQKGDTDGNNG